MESRGEDEGESGRRDGEGRAEREAERVEGRGSQFRNYGVFHNVQGKSRSRYYHGS